MLRWKGCRAVPVSDGNGFWASGRCSEYETGQEQHRSHPGCTKVLAWTAATTGSETTQLVTWHRYNSNPTQIWVTWHNNSSNPTQMWVTWHRYNSNPTQKWVTWHNNSSSLTQNSQLNANKIETHFRHLLQTFWEVTSSETQRWLDTKHQRDDTPIFRIKQL